MRPMPLMTASLASTKVSPFFANYGYHPRWVSELQPPSGQDIPVSFEITKDLLKIHEQCRVNIEAANERYSEAYNASRIETPTFEINDLVLLDMSDLKTTRPSKKLDLKYGGPFKVISKVGTHAYRLELPSTMKNHPVFHVSKLREYRPSTYAGQQAPPPEPIEVEEDSATYEISAVVDSRHQPRTGRLQYLVEWLGFEGTPEHRSWVFAENIGADELVPAFHLAHPNKPRRNKK